jgi:PIN domain nuclease of toxin-antitoxin system
MKLLLDTHLLLWAAGEPDKLPDEARALIEDTSVELWFSAASIWEIAIKHSLGRADFRADPRVLRRALVENGYVELPITGAHAAANDLLPPLHKDPFDRMLIAQAIAESVTLLTSDALVAQYPGPIRLV